MAKYYSKYYNRIKLTTDSSGDDFIELLAVSLAEKLCLRVQAVLEWVKITGMNAMNLADIHRRLHKEGIGGEYDSEILIAVVNQKKLKDIPKKNKQ